jgi:hypothetical protein
MASLRDGDGSRLVWARRGRKSRSSEFGWERGKEGEMMLNYMAE